MVAWRKSASGALPSPTATGTFPRFLTTEMLVGCRTYQRTARHAATACY